MKINIAMNIVILTFAMLVCGWLSVLMGKELSWDLAHYHYYNAYAFFHSRANNDLWPSSFIHQYLNPTIDFVTYFLIHHYTPRMAVFLLGAVHGINFWLLFLIINEFFRSQKKIILVLLLALFGMYGPTTLPGIGSFQNDNLVSIFILGFVFLQIKAYSKRAYSLLFFSGLLLGIGIGLKLTAAVFAIGAIAATLLLPISLSTRIKFLNIWCIATLLGMLLSSGHWMVAMWQQHHNPFFPFFNNVFHSPDFSAVNWRDMRFLPHGIWQTLFYPFYFSWDGRTADAPFRDVRFLLVYALFICASIHWLIEKYFYKRAYATNVAMRFLLAFFIFSYIAWQYYFSIARYIATLEMLAPLVIFLLITSIITDAYLRRALLFGIFFTLFFFMQPIQSRERVTWYATDFFNVKLPGFVMTTPQATVLIAYPAYIMDRDPRPQNYLIPFFPARWHFIGVPFWHGKYLENADITAKIKSAIKLKPMTLFLLAQDTSMPALYQAAQKFGFVANGACKNIFSDRQRITHQKILLCPVEGSL